MVAALMNDTATVARVSMTSMPTDPTWKAMMSYVLTVVGAYSGTSVGIKADIKACGALGTYYSSVITAVTAQNNIGIQVNMDIWALHAIQGKIVFKYGPKKIKLEIFEKPNAR